MKNVNLDGLGPKHSEKLFSENCGFVEYELFSTVNVSLKVLDTFFNYLT